MVNHTPFSASGGVASYYAASKIDITKGSVLKTVPKATFLASVESKDAIYVLLSSKSARKPGHYRLFVSTGTRPGQMQKFRDCPGHSGTLGNYVDIMMETEASIGAVLSQPQEDGLPHPVAYASLIVS